MTKKKSKPSKTAVNEVFALAKEMGWTHVNPQEKQLIELLRRTTYHGRNIVMDVAMTMRRSHPWVNGGPDNTKTTYPDDGRFCCLTEG